MFRGVCQELFWSAVHQFENIFGDYRCLVYDNATTLYCSTPIWNFEKKEVAKQGEQLALEFEHVIFSNFE